MEGESRLYTVERAFVTEIMCIMYSLVLSGSHRDIFVDNRNDFLVKAADSACVCFDCGSSFLPERSLSHAWMSQSVSGLVSELELNCLSRPFLAFRTSQQPI